MLRALRSRSAGWVAKILLGLLVLSFAVWGIEDIFRTFTRDNVAEVGDRTISQDEFRAQYDSALRRAAGQLGRQPTPAEGRILGLDQQVLGEMMAEAALDQTARDFRLNVTDQVVADSVRGDEMFRGPNGVFDAGRFQQILRANNLTEAAFVAQQRQFLRRRQIIDGLTAPIAAPLPLLEAAHRFSNESRAISYVTLDAAGLGEIALPDETALRAFFEARKGAFRTPEYRKLTLLALTPEAVQDAATASEDDLRARYEEQRQRFTTVETRTIDQLRFPTAEAAAQAKAAIDGGKSFDEVVTDQGQTLEAITLGTLTRNQVIDAAVGEAAFALAEGAVSAPVEGTFGPALVRVRDVQGGAVKPFEEARAELAAELSAERAGAEITRRHDAIEEERLGGMTLAEVAARNGLEIRTVEAVDREGKGPDDAALDLPGADALLQAAFDSDAGVENDALRLDGGGYVWFDVAGITAARDRTFEEARARVETAWRTEETAKRIAARAEDLVKRLAGGAALAETAAAEGLTVQTASAITRERGAGDLGRVVATRVFATPVQGFNAAQGQEDNSQIVFQVTSSETPAFDRATDAIQQIGQRIADAIEGDIATTYVLHRQSELGGNVNQAALNAALGDGAAD